MFPQHYAFEDVKRVYCSGLMLILFWFVFLLKIRLFKNKRTAWRPCISRPRVCVDDKTKDLSICNINDCLFLRGFLFVTCLKGLKHWEALPIPS